MLEQGLYLFLIEKTFHSTVFDMDIHLATYIIRLVRAIECRNGEYEVDGECDVCQDES
jgi:hypothetical protein